MDGAETRFDRSTDCEVKLTIYNILEQKVRVLLDEYQNPGNKSVKLDGKDEQGEEVTSGVYFYRFEAGDFVQSKKMVLLK
jgi:flagellar hook assembly protein FlgD